MELNKSLVETPISRPQRRQAGCADRRRQGKKSAEQRSPPRHRPHVTFCCTSGAFCRPRSQAQRHRQRQAERCMLGCRLRAARDVPPASKCVRLQNSSAAPSSRAYRVSGRWAAAKSHRFGNGSPVGGRTVTQGHVEFLLFSTPPSNPMRLCRNVRA